MMKAKLLSIICILLILQNIQAQTTDNQTNTVYAIAEGETFRSGITIERPYIKLTFGEIGGADFLAAQTLPINDVFKAYTPGNDVNGNKTGGTFYLFAPTKDGILSVGVKQNRIKPLYVEENGTALPEYNGITLDESQSDAYAFSFNVKAGCTYKLYCSGSKLGFYGFIFKWNSNSEQPSVYNFETAAEAVKNMKVGWNIGNTLDAHFNWWYDVSYNTFESFWLDPILIPRYMKMLRRAGINAIRLPVRWQPHMDEVGIVDEKWLKRVHEVVDYVTNEGIYCIINCGDDAAREAPLIWTDDSYYQDQNRYKRLWSQIATEFKDYDEHLLFAAWNEILERQEIFGGEIYKDRYKVLNQINQDFVDAVRSAGGNNLYRNLVVGPYYNWSGMEVEMGQLYQLEALEALAVPNDVFPGHILYEVHVYAHTNDPNVNNYLDKTIEILKKYLLSKNVPVIFGEWGPAGDWRISASSTYEFAKYTISQAKANNIAVFPFTGPLSNGVYRTLPAFESREYLEAILKGYYGDNYEAPIPTIEDFNVGIAYTGGYQDFSLVTDPTIDTSKFKGFQLELDKVEVGQFELFVISNRLENKFIRIPITSTTTFVEFPDERLGSTVDTIFLRHIKEDPCLVDIKKSVLIGENREDFWRIDDWEKKFVGARKQFVHTVEFDGIRAELNLFEDDMPLKLKNYKGIRIEFAEPVNPEEFHFKFYGDGSDKDFRPINNGQSTTIDFESLKFNQTINRIVLQHTQEGNAEAKVICAWLIRQDGTEEYCELSPFWGCEIIKKEKYLDSSNPSGDANDDGVVNAADIVEAINAMNGKASVKFKFSNADMNNNGTIDKTDINMIVNIIIGNR